MFYSPPRGVAADCRIALQSELTDLNILKPFLNLCLTVGSILSVSGWNSQVRL